MTLKAAKDVVEGEWVKNNPHTGAEGPFLITNTQGLVGTPARGFFLTDMRGNTQSFAERTYSPLNFDVIPAPMTREALYKKHWDKLLPGSGYKTLNGADPEVFVVDEKDQVIPAWKFLPSKVSAIPNRAPYWDGFQAEFQVTPAACLNSQNDGTCAGLSAVIAEARRKFPKAKLSIQSTIEIPEEMLAEAKDEHIALGCAPSLNAYGLEGADVPNPRLLQWRFAGGHIHKAWVNLQPARANQIVKAVDALLAVPCVTMFQKLDNPIRRKLYGLPGEHRLPKHGLEYRVLSNAWLSHPAIAQFVRETFRLVTGLAKIQAENVFDYKEDEVVSIILNHDVDGAKKLVKRNLSNYKTLFHLAHWQGKGTSKGLELLQSSITEFVDPLKMEQNWRFGAWENNSNLNTTRWNSFANL